jgi:hypothetical protein
VIVTRWPIFLWRFMYDDAPVPLAAGDEISWNVMLVDGEAEGWPGHVLVDTVVQLDDPPPGVRRGPIARTPELSVRWGGSSPVGSRFRIRAGLAADWLNPPYRSVVTGTIVRLYMVWVLADSHPAGWPGAPMRLVETSEVAGSLRRTGDRSEQVAGLLVELAVHSSELAAHELPGHSSELAAHELPGR